MLANPARTFRIYDDPEVAEREDIARHLRMTLEERCAFLTWLLNEKGGWRDKRFERVVRILEVPRG